MELKNRAAFFDYHIEQKFVAGMMLMGGEVKSIRMGKVSFSDSYCGFVGGELWLKNLHIAKFAHQYGLEVVEERRDRKLLLQKHELRKLQANVKEKGYAIIPLKIFENEHRIFKLELGLAKGKKVADKRQSLKEKQLQREMQSFQKRH